MVTGPRIVEDLRAQLIINVLLIGVIAAWIGFHDSVDFGEAIMRPETVIEGEGLIFTSLQVDQLCRGSVHLDADFGITFQFSLIKWPDSDRYLNTH
jgi:hypothetical protein